MAAKRRRETNEVGIKSLTARWAIDMLSVFAAVVILLQVLVSFSLYNYFYESVRQNIMSQINLSGDILASFDAQSDYEFERDSKAVLSNYFEKELFEVQIFDRFGNLIASSQGFLPEQKAYKDYELAKNNSSGIGEWIGEMQSGEKVMAVSMILPTKSSRSMGAIRFVVSMEDVDSAILNSMLIVLIAGLIILLIFAFTGFLFLRSILIPVRKITDTAFRIASGDFKARLTVDEKDKSEIGKLCGTINYMASELESADTLKNDFISSVSHELRTPLTAIKGWGETVKMSIDTDKQLTEKGVDVIIRETGRLSGLVEDLLDFSRLQNGRLTVKLQPTDVLAELGEAVYVYRETAKEQNIALHYDEPEFLPPVAADPARLKQVFINIIDNAIKYSSSGGSVRVVATKHDVYVQITITDTGCGIAAEDLSRVKEKFYKANTTVPGSGIGLAVADEIVHMFGGILEVDSKLGEGTMVSIFLPFIDEKNKEGMNENE